MITMVVAPHFRIALVASDNVLYRSLPWLARPQQVSGHLSEKPTNRSRESASSMSDSVIWQQLSLRLRRYHIASHQDPGVDSGSVPHGKPDPQVSTQPYLELGTQVTPPRYKDAVADPLSSRGIADAERLPFRRVASRQIQCR